MRVRPFSACEYWIFFFTLLLELCLHFLGPRLKTYPSRLMDQTTIIIFRNLDRVNSIFMRDIIRTT